MKEEDRCNLQKQLPIVENGREGLIQSDIDWNNVFLWQFDEEERYVVDCQRNSHIFGTHHYKIIEL